MKISLTKCKCHNEYHSLTSHSLLLEMEMMSVFSQPTFEDESVWEDHGVIEQLEAMSYGYADEDPRGEL